MILKEPHFSKLSSASSKSEQEWKFEERMFYRFFFFLHFAFCCFFYVFVVILLLLRFSKILITLFLMVFDFRPILHSKNFELPLFTKSLSKPSLEPFYCGQKRPAIKYFLISIRVFKSKSY